MRTSTFYILSLALSLCAASQAYAEPARAKQDKLSDSNLFEVHLHQPASGQKRLPSQLMREHHERDEIAEDEEDEQEEVLHTVAPASVTAALTYGPTATASASSSAYATAAPAQITFSPRQPSHFIKHRRQKHNKRRLSAAQYALQVEEVQAEESSAEASPSSVQSNAGDSQTQDGPAKASTRTTKASANQKDRQAA